jgi:hypothetical protein
MVHEILTTTRSSSLWEKNLKILSWTSLAHPNFIGTKALLFSLFKLKIQDHRTPLPQNEEKRSTVPAPAVSASESAFCADGSFSPRMKILSPFPSDFFTPFLNCSCLLALLHPDPLLPRLSPASTTSSLRLPSAPCASQALVGLLLRLPAGDEDEDSGADSGPFLGDSGAEGRAGDGELLLVPARAGAYPAATPHLRLLPRREARWRRWRERIRPPSPPPLWSEAPARREQIRPPPLTFASSFTTARLLPRPTPPPARARQRPLADQSSEVQRVPPSPSHPTARGS